MGGDQLDELDLMTYRPQEVCGRIAAFPEANAAVKSYYWNWEEIPVFATSRKQALTAAATIANKYRHCDVGYAILKDSGAKVRWYDGNDRD